MASLTAKTCAFSLTLIAASLCFACDSDSNSSGGGEEPADASVIPVPDGGELSSDAGGHEDADAALGTDGGDEPDDAGDEDEEFTEKPVPQGDEDQMNACYVPSSWPAVSFDRFAKYSVETSAGGGEASYEFIAYDAYEGGFAQSLWVEIYPKDPGAAQTGAFDLSQEPLDYGTCEHCVVINASNSANSAGKYFMPTSGTLRLADVSTSRISGTLENVNFAEVRLSEAASGVISSEILENGCSTHIAGLSFGYEPPAIPEHVAACFVPKPLNANSLVDFVYDLTFSKPDNFFYRSMSIPAVGSGMPSLTLYIEAYNDETGFFDLAGCETDAPECMHMVVIESTMPDGRSRTFVSDSGTMTITTVNKDLMEGELTNVHFIETVISEDGGDTVFTPVPNGCDTTLRAFVFSSADATPMNGD